MDEQYMKRASSRKRMGDTFNKGDERGEAVTRQLSNIIRAPYRPVPSNNRPADPGVMLSTRGFR